MFLLCLGSLLFLYIYSRLTCGKTKSSTCLTGKTAIVTGANSGLGYQTALNLASRGCSVIMADVANMDESNQNIIKHTLNSNIISMHLDLSSLKSVREFAAKVINNEERLDILINNAGVGTLNKSKTQDGLNAMMQVNYFGHFLLTHLLINLLKKSAPSRIVFTSSCLSFCSNLSLENLNYDLATESSFLDFINGFQNLRVYANSKLAFILASDVFAEKLKESGVTSNCIHPGLVSTPILQKVGSEVNSTLWNAIVRLGSLLFFKSAWEGAQNLVHCAVSRKLETVTGKYFSDCQQSFKPWKAYDRKLRQEIWEASEKLAGLEDHEKL